MGEFTRQRKAIQRMDDVIAEGGPDWLQRKRDNADRNLKHEIGQNIGRTAVRGASKKS